MFVYLPPLATFLLFFGVWGSLFPSPNGTPKGNHVQRLMWQYLHPQRLYEVKTPWFYPVIHYQDKRDVDSKPVVKILSVSKISKHFSVPMHESVYGWYFLSCLTGWKTKPCWFIVKTLLIFSLTFLTPFVDLYKEGMRSKRIFKWDNFHVCLWWVINNENHCRLIYTTHVELMASV